MRTSKQFIVGSLGMGLAITGLSFITAPAAQAVTGVFISELHYDNAGEDVGEFVEITAPAGTDLSTYSVELYNGNGGGPYDMLPLSGTVTDQQGGWGTKVIDSFSNAIENGSPDGLALVNNGTVVEFLSYEGPMTASDGAAEGMASTDIGVAEPNTTPAGQSLQRLENGTWTGPLAETRGAPNGQTVADAPLEATDPADVTGYVGSPVSLQLQASGGTPPYAWAVTGGILPDGLTLSAAGVLGGTPTAAATAEITTTVTDDADATDAVTFTVTVSAAPDVVPIADVQGTGAASPLVDDTVRTEGVVTATYPTGGINGFYLQTPGADTTPGASDGIFVFGPTFDETTLAIGDSVEVQGKVSEFNGLTEITADTVTDVADLGAAQENTVIPGTDCALPGTDCLTGAALEAAKEEFEGEIFRPTGDYTVTDAYDGSAYNPPNSGSSNFFGEIGLAANSTEPLITPTDVIDAQATGEIAARTAYNNAHRVVLDDGSTTTYWNTANNAAGKDTPLPWHTTDHKVRVGAGVTFDQPVVLDYRFGWKVQPVEQVTGAPTGQVTFEQDRPTDGPADVGGDLKLATFNVLNYFTTLGVDYGGCTSFPDRAGNPIAVNSCPGTGPRGAWNQESFARQEAKIVTAVNALDADVVSVEEIENSLVVDGDDRDEAMSALVAALNADAGAGTWAYVASPASAQDPANEAEQDVIRTGFIYKPASVEQVGEADMLFDNAAFGNAREPFAAVFRPVGGGAGSEFAVIVNHFKSKGSGTNDGTGQGNANPDRIAQAEALSTYAAGFAADRGVEAVFLTGDFNAYSMEDPMQVLYGDGYTGLEAEGKHSYSFDGQSGSLDHVLANAAAEAMVTGVDIWEINANETVFNQYSRYNYNATILYEGDNAFSASDHNPEVVGIGGQAEEPTQVQILGTNDFHGRLLADGAQPTQDCDDVTCPAAVLSAAVKQLRSQNSNTVFAAAGDLIGASTFESFIQQDTPTIDALNEAGLEVSAAGNHEFDQGYEDLVGRVQTRADWEYIAANVEEPAGRDDLAETWTRELDGVTVGFVGAVTEELPALVSPDGIEGITVTDIVDATNDAAADLKAGGADIVVLLVHEGSPSTDCASANFTDPATTWGNITQNVSADVDAIVSGHTHLAYNCKFPVDEWVTEGRAVTERPVVSAGQYGSNLNQLVFSVDDATGEVHALSQELLPLMTPDPDGSGPGLPTANYPADPVVTSLVADAVADADELGADPLGQIEAPFNRAKLTDGTTENRGGESTLGNLVAEVQRWAGDTSEVGPSQIAFMNPGGLRADMVGSPGDFPRTLTYKQAAVVQPFANTLVNMDLTGTQIETVLEQQWQRTTTNTVPSRPFLRLGVSKGFTYTYVETPVTVNGVDTFGGEVTGMWLDGEPIDPAATYSVTVNSFLASGGDNFREFANGTGRADTGKVDLEAMVDYMAEFGPEGSPLPVDYSQRAVEVEFPADAPDAYAPGDTVAFDVSSWTMSTADDVKDTEVQVKLGDTVLGASPVDNTIGAAVYDQNGTALVAVILPNDVPSGETALTLVGTQTGTEVTVPITVEAGQQGPVATTTKATPAKTRVQAGRGVNVTVVVTGAGITPTGRVEISRNGRTIVGGRLVGGKVVLKIPGKVTRKLLGRKTFVAKYLGSAAARPSRDSFTIRIVR